MTTALSAISRIVHFLHQGIVTIRTDSLQAKVVASYILLMLISGFARNVSNSTVTDGANTEVSFMYDRYGMRGTPPTPHGAVGETHDNVVLSHSYAENDRLAYSFVIRFVNDRQSESVNVSLHRHSNRK